MVNCLYNINIEAYRGLARLNIWGSPDETHLSTAQYEEKENTRFQEENEDEERKAGSEKEESKGA
jgi:hypothetical protein